MRSPLTVSNRQLKTFLKSISAELMSFYFLLFSRMITWSKILKKQLILQLEIFKATTGLLIAKSEKQPLRSVSMKTFFLSSSVNYLYSEERVTIRGQISTTWNSLMGSTVFPAF